MKEIAIEWNDPKTQMEGFRIVTNSDLTEGRGYSICLGYTTFYSTAERIAKGKGVMGTDASIEPVTFYGQAGSAGYYGPVFFIPRSPEDEKKDHYLAKRQKALQQLKDAGFNETQIADLINTLK